MAFGFAGRFFGQLMLCLREGLPIPEALRLVAGDAPDPGAAAAILRIRDRVQEGAYLWEALGDHPAYFMPDLLPLLRDAENQGLHEEALEIFAAWPDPGMSGVEPLLARLFGRTVFKIREGLPLGEAFKAARDPSDPGELAAAGEAIARACVEMQSVEDAMARFPGLFSPAVRRIVQQMVWNGNAEKTFAHLAAALSRGWFAARPGTAAPPPM